MFTFETFAFIVLIVSIIISTKKDSSSNALPKDNSNILRGIFALCIMIFHISKETDLFYPLFAYLGMTVVGAFFFLSGFGLMKSYLNRSDYHKSFLLNRITKLFLPYLCMVFIYWIYDYFTDNPFSLSFVLHSILGSETLVMYSWFIKDIIIHYLIFYLLMMITRNRKEYMFYISIIMFLIDLVATLFSINNPYLLNGMFSLGMIVAYNEKTVLNLISGKRTILLIITLIIGLLFRTKPIYASRFSLIEKIIFVLFAISAMSGYRIQNRFFALAGKISLELYMTHGLAKMIVRRFYGGPLFVQDFFIYILSFCISLVLYRLFSYLDIRLRSFFAK